jgi:3-oxoacyl-[acyl-carrier protein] reductase
MKVDHTREEDCNEMVKTALGRYGQIDVLVNVAGVWPQNEGEAVDEGRWHRSRPPRSTFATSNKEDWDRIIDVDLNGARNCTRSVINHMMERHSGKIVCFSSIAALTGLANDVEYSTAKAGILGFIRALAREVESYGIQVNCVTPSGTLSERMLSGMERARHAGREIDLSRFCTPEEVAEAVLFLASEASNHTSGQNIVMGAPAGA